MCVGLSAKVVRIADGMAMVDASGAKREISVQLLDDVEPGELPGGGQVSERDQNGGPGRHPLFHGHHAEGEGDRDVAETDGQAVEEACPKRVAFFFRSQASAPFLLKRASALAWVASRICSRGRPLISAILAAMSLTKAGSLRLPRCGTGAM